MNGSLKPSEVTRKSLRAFWLDLTQGEDGERSPLTLRGRALMLVRNVGHLLTTSAVLDRDGNRIDDHNRVFSRATPPGGISLGDEDLTG